MKIKSHLIHLLAIISILFLGCEEEKIETALNSPGSQSLILEGDKSQRATIVPVSDCTNCYKLTMPDSCNNHRYLLSDGSGAWVGKVDIIKPSPYITCNNGVLEAIIQLRLPKYTPGKNYTLIDLNPYGFNSNSFRIDSGDPLDILGVSLTEYYGEYRDPSPNKFQLGEKKTMKPLVDNSSHDGLGAKIKYYSSGVRIKYSLWGQTQYQSPVDDKITLYSNQELKNRTISVEVMFAGQVAKSYTYLMYDEPKFESRVFDSYPRLGQSVRIISTPDGNAQEHDVRIKYTLYGQSQYQYIQKVSGGNPIEQNVTLWNNPGLAYSTVKVQSLRNGKVVSETSKTIYP